MGGVWEVWKVWEVWEVWEFIQIVLVSDKNIPPDTNQFVAKALILAGIISQKCEKYIPTYSLHPVAVLY